MPTQQDMPAQSGIRSAARRERRTALYLAVPILTVASLATCASGPSLWGTRTVRGIQAPAAGPAPELAADYVLRLRAPDDERLSFEAQRGGQATLLLLGLRRGGAVTITVNGTRPANVELLAKTGEGQARADSALVTAAVTSGTNRLEVSETDGVQVVRVRGTNRWFATSTQSPRSAMFSVNLDDMARLTREYPVKVSFGPQGDAFLWFSAKWDRYYGEVYATSFSRVRGTSGPRSAVLSYVLEYPERHFIMPTQLTLIPDPGTGAFTIRVYQALRATGTTALGDGAEFLHVKITDDGAVDWQDGTVDYTWYRSQSGDCDDAPLGSHTGMVRMDDNTTRIYAWRSSTDSPLKEILSSLHHTGAAVALDATNTIGGFFSKAGVGSCGWVFHYYRSNSRSEVTPVYGHCGDGADTHFFASAVELYHPFPLAAGDVLETEYSLTMLPSEVTREDIEDLNEADLHLFGTEKEQLAAITGWIGTKQAVGLRRSDDSLILLGLGREPALVPLPAETLRKARSAYRIYSLTEPTSTYLDVSRGSVQVRPGWITVVDCGAALWEPIPAPGNPSYGVPQPTAATNRDGEKPAAATPGIPAGSPAEGLLLRRK